MRLTTTTQVSGDLGAAIGELKANPAGEPQAHGSGNLTRWLLENDWRIARIQLSGPMIQPGQAPPFAQPTQQ